MAENADGAGYLRLADAMEDALADLRKPKNIDEDAVLVVRRVSVKERCGIRFQRCGGGRRVIRRQRRAV